MKLSVRLIAAACAGLALSSAAWADKDALEAAKAAKAAQQAVRAKAIEQAKEAAKAASRARAEAVNRFGVGCPSHFEGKLAGPPSQPDVLLCQMNVAVPVAMTQCPAEFTSYFTRAGRRDVCIKPNFLPEGVLEEKYQEGVHYVYATEDLNAIETAKQRLENGFGTRLTVLPPVGLRDPSRFRPPQGLDLPQIAPERIVAAVKREFKLDGLASSGEDATIVTFVVYTPSQKFKH